MFGQILKLRVEINEQQRLLKIIRTESLFCHLSIDTSFFGSILLTGHVYTIRTSLIVRLILKNTK